MPNISQNLYQTAQKVMTPGKGILASDERPSSANKNLIKAGIQIPRGVNEERELRGRYRELFINTPSIENYLNGIIISDETFWQSDSKGKLFRETILEKGINLIVKVDNGTVDMPEHPGERVTIGLERLAEKLPKYYEHGARLAKWRSVTKIGEDIPTGECIEENANRMSEYALQCQQAGIVPIIEPEVLINGDHSIDKAEEVTLTTLTTNFENLREHGVDLKGLILKTSMVVPGSECPDQSNADEIAQATVRTLLQSVPQEVPGIVFLSGGQSPIEATINLNSIAELEPLPWQISFSYLRAIEGPATQIWGGKEENVEEARKVFLKRLKMDALAEKGEYNPKLESE